MTREEAIIELKLFKESAKEWNVPELVDALDMAIEALQDKEDEPQFYTEDDYWNGTFAESAEAYKAWTGEEMGKTSDEINEMNKEIIKDILKMMPTAYMLEALGVSTFEELTEQADKPHGRLIDADKLKKQLDTVYNEMANERERKGLRLARWFLISAPTVSATKKLNNQIHLCDSCKYNYPNCPSENEDVLFGNGVGNDNICCCAKYLASADRPHGEWIPIAIEPNTADHVLVTYKWDDDDYEVSELDYWVTEYEAEKGNEKCKWLIDHVTAWMPLPKPYREDGEVEE